MPTSVSAAKCDLIIILKNDLVSYNIHHGKSMILHRQVLK